MPKTKLKLDSTTHPSLLCSLWDIEKRIEQNNLNKAKELLANLIEEVRYSEIIESYTLLD